MVYISAQEDKLYFIWQLEIQIFNFRRVGILDGQIHILIAYNTSLSEHSRILKIKYPKVGIFFYRCFSPYYISATRPNILAQHFERFRYLEKETIFYHDSDIIFRELPVIGESFDCLGSDTRGYTGPRYINSKGPDLLTEMCKLTGIAADKVSEENSVGAQYMLNGINSEFWRKVEIDCLAIYQFLSRMQTGENPIQKWCSDMWAVHYNLIYFGHQITAHKELLFCWATDNIDKWHRYKIYHDAGVTKSGELFFKGDFKDKSPIGLEHKVNPAYCSIKYVQEMQKLIEFED